MKLSEDFLYAIYSVVEEIPEGNVSTYGQIASLAGYPKNSRLVGKSLSMAGNYGDYPCHRVVNVKGRITPGWDLQKSLLLKEGITFKTDTCVDMKKHKWYN